jgi:FkbM family methyltransferase
LREAIKAIVPAPIDLFQKSIRTGIHRLMLWRGLWADCSGVSAADQRVLIKSFWSALPRLTAEPGKWREPQLTDDATVAVMGGFKFFIRAGTDDLGHIRQKTHQKLIDSLLNHLPPGGIAVDAGANIGIFSANFARVLGPQGRVIAIEMMPETARSLRQTIALNELGNVEVVEMALSDEAGQDLTIGMPDGSHFGQASIIRHRENGGQNISVRTTTLDEITSGIERLNVLKMDLEGAELMALGGASRTLKITDAILYEQSDDDDRVDIIFKENGFRIRRIDGLNKLAERFYRYGARVRS